MNEDEFSNKLDTLIRLARWQGSLRVTLGFLAGIIFSYFMNWISFVWK